MTAGAGSFQVSAEELRALLAPSLQRTRSRLLRLACCDDGHEKEWWEYDLEIDATRLTVNDAYKVCYDIGLVIHFPNLDWMTPSATMSLLRAGGIANLIGQRESHWLEVKSTFYDFSRDKASRIEIAQDVARFANAEDGGVLILGAQEKDEIIKSISPFLPSPQRLESYRDTINHRIFPVIDGLQIEAFPVGQEEIIAILVPPQFEERKPFLVKGAIAAEKYEGAFISIVRRRGDTSITISAEELHGLIAIGRAFLRHGLDPRRLLHVDANTKNPD